MIDTPSQTNEERDDAAATDAATDAVTAASIPKKQWDASRYDQQFGYISRDGRGVVELLDAQPGERVLDLGCGTGQLLAELLDSGVDAIGVDADPGMLSAARELVGAGRVQLADGHRFTVDAPCDAVFSNAALHWMTRPEDVISSVRAALRPGGRFVAEFGAGENVAEVLDALQQARQLHGFDGELRTPWYFPEPNEYAALLEAAGFQIAHLSYFSRPTRLDDCPNGISDWAEMFADTLLADVPGDQRPAVLASMNDIARPALFRDGHWSADYWRLRFDARLVD